MKNVLALALSLGMLLLAACNEQPQQTYNYAPTQQQQVESINQNGQQVMSRACINGQGQVVEDRYCDAQWVAQQQAIAQQNHDDQLLRDLMLYHFMFGGSYGANNVYIGGVTVLPPGYGYMPYREYHRTVIERHITINKTYVTAPAPKGPTPTFSQRKPGQTSVTAPKPSVSVRQPSSSNKSFSSSSRGGKR